MAFLLMLPVLLRFVRPLRSWLGSAVLIQPSGTLLLGPRTPLTPNIARDVERSSPGKRPFAAIATGPRCCRFAGNRGVRHPGRGSPVTEATEALMQNAQIVALPHQIAIAVEEPIQTGVCLI